jgi:hypothetical protein
MQWERDPVTEKTKYPYPVYHPTRGLFALVGDWINEERAQFAGFFRIQYKMLPLDVMDELGMMPMGSMVRADGSGGILVNIRNEAPASWLFRSEGVNVIYDYQELEALGGLWDGWLSGLSVIKDAG